MLQLPTRKAELLFQPECAELGDALLVNRDKKRLQRFLKGLSERLCHDTVNGCYIYVKAIFAEAIEQRTVLESPTKTLTLPHRERITHTVRLKHVQRVEDALDGRGKVIFQLLSRCGSAQERHLLSSGWTFSRNHRLYIQRTYFRGE